MICLMMIKIIVEAPIVSDDAASTVVVSGNYTYDKTVSRLEVFPNLQVQLLIEGDITDIIDPDPDGVSN